MKNVPITTPLLFFLLVGATQVIAQDTQDDKMRQLQTRMDELKAQMTQLQADTVALAPNGPNVVRARAWLDEALAILGE